MRAWHTYLQGFIHQSLSAFPICVSFLPSLSISLSCSLSLFVDVVPTSLFVKERETSPCRVGDRGSAAETDIISFSEEVFPSRYLHSLSSSLSCSLSLPSTSLNKPLSCCLHYSSISLLSPSLFLLCPLFASTYSQ